MKDIFIFLVTIGFLVVNFSSKFTVFKNYSFLDIGSFLKKIVFGGVISLLKNVILCKTCCIMCVSLVSEAKILQKTNGKKNWNSWEMLIFWNNCALLLKVNILLENMLIRKFDFLCDCLYTSRNCRILIKTLIFLRKCLFVHVLIFIRVFLLLENCYFDSKYDFIRWHFGQKYHFSNKIYISVGINSLEKSSNFLRKGVNLVVSFGKNDVWFL